VTRSFVRKKNSGSAMLDTSVSSFFSSSAHFVYGARSIVTFTVTAEHIQ